MKLPLILGGLSLLSTSGFNTTPNSKSSQPSRNGIFNNNLIEKIHTVQEQPQPKSKRSDAGLMKSASTSLLNGKLIKEAPNFLLCKWIRLPLMASAISVLGVEAYTRLPSNAVSDPIYMPANTSHLVLILHGTGCKDEPTLAEIENRFRHYFECQSDTAVINYQWSPYSDNPLRAEAHGKRLGKQIGKDLSNNYDKLESIHIISHSAGAFLQNPISKELREKKGAFFHIESTYIDSMLINGGWLNLDHGKIHYGKYANFSSNFFTHNTPVPGCNRPINHAFNLDVTDAYNSEPNFSYYRGPESHFYPLTFYLNHLDASDMEPKIRSHENFPLGDIVIYDPYQNSDKNSVG